MIKRPEWKYKETATKNVQIMDVNEEERELDVLDMKASIPQMGYPRRGIKSLS